MHIENSSYYLLLICQKILFHLPHRKSFISRPLKEVDHSYISAYSGVASFNSRPHKEVDTLVPSCPYFIPLSIHDLTRRSTIRPQENGRMLKPFNSRPHKEVDGSRLRSGCRRTIFQFTTSQGGRRKGVIIVDYMIVFQFTTSQGGRHQQNQQSEGLLRPFNSRPHKEVDLYLLDGDLCCIVLSIHDLTRRSTT